MNKKLLSVFLSIIIVFSMACTAVADDADLVYYSCFIEKFAGNRTQQEKENPEYDVYLPDKESVREVISEAIQNHLDSVDLSSFEIPYYLHTGTEPVVDELCALFTDLVNYTPEFYYVLGLYSFEGMNGYVIDMPLKYRFNDEEILEIQRNIDSECALILSEITTDMGDLEKALAVHDYFVLNYEYDYAVYTLGSEGYKTYPESFSMDGLFLGKKAVCQGFAIAYKYVLGLLGIEAVFCPSDAMVHAWDLVKINGNWYHVDVTHDKDMLPYGYVGWVSHRFFLLSDAQMTDEGYYGWAAEHGANNTTYDNYFWRGIWSGIFYRDGFWYYSLYKYDDKTGIHYNQILKRDVLTGEITPVLDNTTGWKYFHSYGNLKLFLYGDRIFYNGPQKIYSIDINGEDMREVYTPTEITNKWTHILGIAKNGTEIIYNKYTYPSGDPTLDGINSFSYFDNWSDNFLMTASYYSDELTVRVLNNPDMLQGMFFAAIYDDSDSLVDILTPVQITYASVYSLNFTRPNISQGYIKIMAWDFSGSPLAGSIRVNYQ